MRRSRILGEDASGNLDVADSLVSFLYLDRKTYRDPVLVDHS